MNTAQSLYGTFGTVTRESWKSEREMVATSSRRHHDSFHPDPRDLVKARNVIVHALNNGGATIGRDYVGIPLTGKSGYIIGGYASDASYNVPLADVWSVAITTGDVAITTRRYVADFRVNALAYHLHRYVVSTPRHDTPEYIGVWYENDRITYDVVRIIDGIGVAVDDARRNNQAAIYDIRNASDIDL